MFAASTPKISADWGRILPDAPRDNWQMRTKNLARFFDEYIIRDYVYAQMIAEQIINIVCEFSHANVPPQIGKVDYSIV